jgi:hypothetical protein
MLSNKSRTRQRRCCNTLHTFEQIHLYQTRKIMLTNKFWHLTGTVLLTSLLTCCAAPEASPGAAKSTVAANGKPAPKICTTNYITGSHVQTQTVCATEEERAAAQEQADNALSDIRMHSGQSSKGGN